ncbi:hypothetical protein CAPTEDRAFT_184914 [Capitella teleta]|uniref:Uncharacterized protein n=1 Tax=Capitella teleta TaxID=283909 RepID=X1ZH83_CAPTE|nr:hypothetical protein CAPTEDRAFT_184914 [Capitella teleta]|eukprot:ELT90128.1 hypothetical protein CAPTEDRAFT_184914 [Capitella teleta]
MAVVQDTRNALWRRDEQLKRWEQSETCQESHERDINASKIKFNDGCVFLAACSSGDKDEVQRLLDKGADINTANIDGLTALHQCGYQLWQFLILIRRSTSIDKFVDCYDKLPSLEMEWMILTADN